MSLVTKSFGDLATYNSEDMPPPLLGKAWHKGYHAHLRHFVLSRLRSDKSWQCTVPGNHESCVDVRLRMSTIMRCGGGLMRRYSN